MADKSSHNVDPSKRIFLISQIGDKGTTIRRRADNIADYIVKPVASEFNLTVLRSDRDPTPGPITSQILTSILNSRVIVADLTGRNANVYYELAFAHSFGVPVTILVDNPSTLTFDVKNERVITIGDDGNIAVDQAEETKKELKKVLEVVLDEDYKPASLVTEAARVQRLEELAPEDPEASELTDIKQRLDTIYTYMRQRLRTSRNAKTSDMVADLRTMTSLITSLAVEGRLKPQEVQALVTDETSLAFDEWVTRTLDSMPRISAREEDFDDLPF